MAKVPEVGTTLVVAWRRGKGFDFGRVETAERFTSRLASIVSSFEESLDELSERPYAIGDDLEDDEYMTCPLGRRLTLPRRPKATEASKIELASDDQDAKPQPRPPATVTTENPREFRERLVAFGGMDPVGIDTLRKHPVSFYAILRGTDLNDRVAYVRNLNPMRLAKPGIVLAGLGDTLTALDKQVFVMDDAVDLIIRPDKIQIFNKSFFDGLFFGLSGDGNELNNIVNEALSKLEILPATLTMMVARSRERKRLRRKIVDIKHSGHLLSVTMEDFRRALAEAGLERKRFLRKEKGVETIFAADEEDADLLFYVLNDDLFNGALTGNSFAVSKKHVRRKK